MIQTLPFSPNHKLSWLERFFKKNYNKKPYNQFMWWRSYTPKRKPLTNKHSLEDRILNGDFDLAPEMFECQIVEHRMNQKFIDLNGEEDQWREATSLDKARRKRLLADYDKEEAKRLDELKKAFVLHIKITKDQYDKEVVQTRSTSLIKFYESMKKKYGTYLKPLSYITKA